MHTDWMHTEAAGCACPDCCSVDNDPSGGYSNGGFYPTPIQAHVSTLLASLDGLSTRYGASTLLPTVFAGAGGMGTTETTASAPATLDAMAQYLVDGFWNGPYSFNLGSTGTSPNDGVLYYNYSGFSGDPDGITDKDKFYVDEAFKLFSEALGITFVQTTSTNTNLVDFFFSDDEGGAYAQSYSYSDGTRAYSYINVMDGWYNASTTYDDYTLQTFLHEIGHALGLGHQGPYNGSATYGTDNTFENDSWQASMMSYFSQTENTTIQASLEFLQTPMAVDWIALDTLYGSQGYGVDHAFLGDTVYGFNTNITSDVSDIWANFADWGYRTASTIIDAGGIDTLDLSGYSQTQLINLRVTNSTDTSASVSNIGGRIGNLTLAVGTVIENAVGGTGADTFYGNEAANTFWGNDGNDKFYDSIGADTYYGDAGTDTVYFNDSFSSYSFSIAGAFLVVINVVVDLVYDTIEWLDFSGDVYSYDDLAAVALPNTPPVGYDDVFDVNEDVVLTGGNVLTNDTDDDGNTLTVSQVNGLATNVGSQIMLASTALLTLNSDGEFSYDPNGAFDALDSGQTANDSFTYTISDGQGGFDTATVTLTIDGYTPPVVTSANVLFDFEDSSIGKEGMNISGLNVVADGSFPDEYQAQSFGDPVIIDTSLESFDFDSAVFRAVSGRVRITIEAYDGETLVGTSTINVKSNRETSRTFDGTFDGVTEVRITANGDFLIDDLSFVTYNVFGPNAPIAADDAFGVSEDAVLTGNLLADNGNGFDSDPEGDPLTVTSVDGETNGLVTLTSGAIVTFNDDGTFSYNPSGKYDGLYEGETATDSFTYVIEDIQGNTDTGTATITIDGVGPAPTTFVLDFDGGQSVNEIVNDDEFVFTGAELTTRAKGVVSGSQAAQSMGDDTITIELASGDNFDFESVYLTAVSGRNITATITAYDDSGEPIGSQDFNTTSKKETFVSLNDETFDNVDYVTISATGGIIVDDLTMIF